MNDSLFYTCSLIEFMGRCTKNHRKDIVRYLGNDIERIYNYQDIFHCEPIAKVSDDFIKRHQIPEGSFDNIKSCQYEIPDYWDIGEVFARLIEDSYAKDEIFWGLRETYDSWIANKILNFNSDLYYQPRDYLAECYRQGKILVV